MAGNEVCIGQNITVSFAKNTQATIKVRGDVKGNVSTNCGNISSHHIFGNSSTNCGDTIGNGFINSLLEKFLLLITLKSRN